ncbi:hypothetical protein ES319_A05G112800v1 [Gossypium barbadense]|uniref:BZIP domain-containing protein n=3 Tax=Gossypium TaxID=3633 RepID=A0A5J5VMQ3_GOSBA|nr:hypothetical protein ES319_A05G112800v1 [Gossypium barbadense]TYH16406.1 hypothetical protein ES288_A05G114900v1 [Gossypium darwinii]
MNGKNKMIEQQKPAAGSGSGSSSASAWPKYSIGASAIPTRFSFMKPANLPICPTSFNGVNPKPYSMNQVGGAGSSARAISSATKTSFFQGCHSFAMRSEKNNTDKPLMPPVENSARTEAANVDVVQVRGGHLPEQNMDPKKLKRVISNRLSAQRSRIRKIQRLCDMEKKVQSLETLVAVLSSKVQREKDKQFLLRIEQQELRERIEAFANRETMVDARIEKRRAEIESLRQPQFTSQQQQMQVQTRHANSNQGGGGDGDYMGKEINRLNQLSLHQKNPGDVMMPDRQTSGGQLPNVGLDQYGVGELQNLFLCEPNPQQDGSFDSDIEEIQQILNFDPRDGLL